LPLSPSLVEERPVFRNAVNDDAAARRGPQPLTIGSYDYYWASNAFREAASGA